jgi:hypothetical protein
MRDAKWEMLLDVFSDWSDTDLQALSEVLTRYLDDSEAFMVDKLAQDTLKAG